MTEPERSSIFAFEMPENAAQKVIASHLVDRRVQKEKKPVKIRNLSKNEEAELTYELTDRQIDILLAGGLVNHLKR